MSQLENSESLTQEGYGPVMGNVLGGVDRCPHCNTATPTLSVVWNDVIDGRPWAVYSCTRCNHAVLVEGVTKETREKPTGIVKTRTCHAVVMYPGSQTVHEDLPERARNYLKQALESPPDGAAMLANSALDAMLKAKGYKNGTIRDRIDKAVEGHLLTRDMGAWAHEVRTISNDPRHADEISPHVSREEAVQVINFAQTLGNILFVMPLRIQRGKEATKQAQAAIARAGSSRAGG